MRKQATKYLHKKYDFENKCFVSLDKPRIRKQATKQQSKLFKEPRVLPKNYSFITFDIETLYAPYKSETDNEKYIRHHVPWLISYNLIKWNESLNKFEI